MNRRSLIALAFALLAWLAPTVSSRAAEVVWSGLVYATNEDHPSAVPRQLAAYSQKLQHVFGYNQLELLSEHREAMDEAQEHWLLPGKDFCLLVNTRKQPEIGYLLSLQLYQEKRLLVRTQVKLVRQSPIFFRGPLCGDGQLIIVLLIE